MMAQPSFGLGKQRRSRCFPGTPVDGVATIWPRGNSGSQESGGHSLPVYGEGLAGELLNITHTSLVAVSQDAGKKGAIMLTPACCLGHPSVGRELRCFALSMTC